jgi:hypothetical protein
MHHPHRRRPVVRTGFLDAEVLEPVLHVLQRRGAEEFRDAEIKRIGQFFALNKVKKCPWGARLSRLTLRSMELT